MIISDTYRFAFVHIPKCAGTSVRRSIEKYDDRGGAYTNRVEYHEALGTLDYVHIPLFVLAEHFPYELHAIRDYWSFVIVRDPFRRFASSFSQRMKMYGEIPPHEMRHTEVRREVDIVLDYLASMPTAPHLLPADFIHFQKQVDYVYFENQRLIDSVYTTDALPDLYRDLQARGVDLQTPDDRKAANHQNRALVYRNKHVTSTVERMAGALRPLVKRLPDGFKGWVRSHMQVPVHDHFRDIFESSEVRGFVREYYAGDLELLRGITAGHD